MARTPSGARPAPAATFSFMPLVVVAVMGAAALLGGMLLRDDPAASTSGLPELMGSPALPAPGAASGSAEAGGVRVEGSRWDMGRVPLNRTVSPTFLLVNAGEDEVALGEPHIEVVEGCCPSPALLSARTLAAGETATLSVPMAMHPGMDGPHRFDVHVPAGGESLTVVVTGDFRG